MKAANIRVKDDQLFSLLLKREVRHSQSSSREEYLFRQVIIIPVLPFCNKDEATSTFKKQCDKFLLRRALRFMKDNHFKAFDAWRSFARNQSLLRLRIMRMICWRGKRAIQEWRNMTHDNCKMKINAKIAKEAGRKHKQVKAFRRWHKYIQFQKKIRKACYANSHTYKDIHLGFSFVRGTWCKYKKRKMFDYWRNENKMRKMMVWAFEWSLINCRKRHFQLWKNNAVRQIEIRSDDEYRVQVLDSLKQLRDKKNGIYKSLSVTVIDQDNNTASRNSYEAIVRRDEYNIEINRIILNTQAERRRMRVISEKLERHEKWLKKWNDIEERRIEKCQEKIKSWNERSEIKKNCLPKCMKKLERQINCPGFTVTSPAIIALCTLDGRMGSKGILLDEFMEQLTGKSKDGVVSKRDELESLLNKLKIHLSSSSIRDIFDEIGYTNDEGIQQIPISDFHEKLLSTYTSNGIQASRWKIYISPIHEVVVLQDVVTGEVSDVSSED